MRSARTDGKGHAWALVVPLAVVVAGSGVAAGASSRDYPGPCAGETTASGVPLFLAADYHGANPVYGVVILNDTGRFRLGISCVGTGFVVARVGPDSALCTVRGRCTPDDLLGLTEDDINAVRSIPGEVPFFHICEKHGFGWYDAVGVAPGIYLAIAKSGSAVWGFVDGHGTMDTYAYVGNGGAYQPVNCPPPPVCGNGIVEPGESCDDFNTAGGDCCSPTCTFEPAGSACPGDGDLCTPGTCDGAGVCMHENACVDQPIDGAKLKIERKNGKEKLLWVARTRTPVASSSPADPSSTGATLELLSPSEPAVSMDLPASGWTTGGGGAKFKNRDAPAGVSPVRVAVLRQGRSIKVVARRTGFALAAPLVGVGLRLVSGTLATCSYFHAGTVVTDVPGRFEARGPGAVSASCDRVTLSGGVPGGGTYNPGLPPFDPGDPTGGLCGGDLLCPY
jgi:cysteine-rich repeat protein